MKTLQFPDMAQAGKHLNPRDVKTLALWKQLGVEVIHITISQLSPLRGQLAENLHFPGNTRIAFVSRDREALFSLHNTFIKERDVLYLLTDDEQALRDYLIA